MEDEDYMRRALELSGMGFTSPNPMVGCVIVKDGRIIAEGYHRRAGLPHAEIDALKKLKLRQARNATMYVTLEPCCHYGRTPPCTDTIIKAGVARVVASMRDPNPLVAGKGFKALREAGIKVEVGLLSKEAHKLNEAYVHYMKTGTPYVILKSAESLDGKIATSSGESRWITGEKARKQVHELRARTDAVLVGIGTILKDDPKLTCRINGGRDPLRIIVDSSLRIPTNAKVLADRNVVVATTRKHSKTKKKKLEGMGVSVFILKDKEGHVDLKDLMRVLGEVGVTTLLIEGGGEINAAALKAKIVNKIMFYIAPKIIGGRNAKTPVEGDGTRKLEEALQLTDVSAKTVGDDILITAYVKK
jgi:diaminohydroxyphosphoribosylaminopyrimidine deaminase/5-amino-6-(5-phosphoribosylamino)uracil reductase